MSAALQGYGFRYKHGDRPLEGYTVQHAAGRGGFGEVYYAVSDSGRQVAIKALNGFEAIELRGVSQCMNLKSPHLVTIFDIRHNDLGQPFVIMEYVSGPSLRQMLDESPAGLGSQKSAFFLREIAKGLAYLHDCGIVHRDLKPANVFYENGSVKIGDYGLSKAIGASQHSAQTITVGTVHYMAPEVGKGQYDKRIDIYALGALLYELLTGQPPFLGGSPAEILMRHLSDAPDVAGVEEPFASVIRKAMAKIPDDRYQNVQEMLEAIFGAEHVRQSVSVFSPDSLSMIAQRVAARVAAGPDAGSRTPPPVPGPLLQDAPRSWRAGGVVDYEGKPLRPRWLGAARYVWLGSAGLFMLTALMLFILMGLERLRNEEFVVTLSCALSAIFLALLSLWRIVRNVFVSWWQYLARPVLLWLCLQSVITSSVVLGTMRPRTEEVLVGVFFIMAPIFLIATIGLAALIRRRETRHAPAAPTPAGRLEAFVAPAPPAPPRPAPALSTASTSPAQVPAAPHARRQQKLNSLGYVCLTLSVIVGVAMAIDLPGIIAVENNEFAMSAAGGEQAFYLEPWSRFVRMAGSAVTWAGMLGACLLLALGRRALGPAHVIRAALAVAAFGMSCVFIYVAFDWSGGLDNAGVQAAHNLGMSHPYPSAILDRYLRDAAMGPLFPAGACMTGGLLLLLWPARQGLNRLLDDTSSASAGALRGHQYEEVA